MFNLNNKIAVVTGATRGLGQGIALGLASAGADIVGVGTTSLNDTKEKVEKLGRRFLALNSDISDISNLDIIINETVSKLGRLDILVNNAGIIRRSKAIDFSEKDWDDVLNINLKSLFFLSQKAAKYFMENKINGKIINIASMLSYQGGINVASYTASKSGVMGLTRLLANEWAQYGININAIAPGYMATDMTHTIKTDSIRNGEILSRIPQGRWGTPNDLAGPAVFLASSASDYINGFTIAVDGGFLGR